MRPRTLILPYSDEPTISLMRLPLECNTRYRVIGEETEAGALAAFVMRPFELVIYDCTRISDFRTVQRMKQIAPRVPVILLGTAKQIGLPHPADALLVRPSMADLLQRIGVMTIRKRGPKPGTKRLVASVGIERGEAVCA